MSTSDFKTDTNLYNKKAYLRKIKSILGFSLSLTGMVSASGIIFILFGVKHELWNDIGVASFAYQILKYASVTSVFIALLKIVFGDNPFSQTLVICIKSIGIMFTLASFGMPRLPEYTSTGFELFAWNDFVLLDGGLLTIGLLFIILSTLIKIAFEMQKEMDEIL